MKPERLEMAGFAPFRSATEVDFSGLELFALTGPTGAGKSSVIDAITFALYGVVARYDDRRSVEPVISLGAAEARIRFEFTVGDRRYTAARVVRRTKGGATTAEARLESEGEVMASGAGEVTRAVEKVLGLGISHFTRSVVLPQGDFAAFLHDTPSGQQDLVKALLDLGVLGRVRTLANERAKTATALAQSARQRLDLLADATAEAEATSVARLDLLTGLTGRVTEAETAMAEVHRQAGERVEEARRLRGQCDSAAKVKLPRGVAELSGSLDGAKAGVEKADEMVAAATEAAEVVSKESESLPSRDRLEAAASLADRLEAARLRLAAIDETGLTAAVAEATQAVSAAAAARDRAVESLDASRAEHAAHALLTGLGPGDPCPVCHRALEDGPGDPPADLEDARRALSEAHSVLEVMARRQQEATRSLVEAQASRKAEDRTIQALQEELKGLPAGQDLVSLVAQREAADLRLDASRQNVREAKEALAAARRVLAELESTEKGAWERFHATRDEVAALGPPAASRTDLAGAWAGLVGWAEAEVARLRVASEEAIRKSEQAESDVKAKRGELDAMLLAAGVEGTGPPSARLAGAVATARAERERLAERRRQREALESDLGGFDADAKVAGALGAHLKSNNFEGWLLSEALVTLVDGANGMLDDLSSGTYSLAVRDRVIEVVDRRNADERRSVRSLSGGETFLVSLALALSLGRQLIELSERGGASLDAIFLDEGFGTLDTETLDTVSTVVSELAARGRIVGLVTHVKELADQIPVRFQVSRGVNGSTIERVEG